mgnify:CR=1 FL=1
MSTPFDIVDYILPDIKALISWNLAKKGVGQRQIARALSTSQALISKYLSKDPGYYLEKLSKLGIDISELNTIIEVITTYIIKGRLNDAISYLTIYLLTLLKGRKLCNAHKLIARSLSDCNVCDYIIHAYSDELVERVKYVTWVLETLPDAELLVPEIGMNVVEARPNAKTVYDVVGIPGRIVKVFNKVKAVSQPTYGGSRFMASLILEVMKYFPHIRSAVNIKYSEEAEDALMKLNFNVTKLKHYETRSLNTILSLISNELMRASTAPDAIIDLGPPGFEHLIYVLAEDSLKLVNKLNNLMNELRRKYKK